MLKILSYNFIDFKGFKVSLLGMLWLTLIYCGVWLLLRVFRIILHRRFLKRNIIDKAREFTIFSLVRYVVFTLTFLVFLGVLGVKVSWLFGAGIPLLVGIGLGLQAIFKDFVSGIVLSIEGSFKVGDYIEIDGMVALVRKIDLRTSKVEMGSGVIVIVPNSKLIDSQIINWSHSKKEVRSHILIHLAYGTDVAVARHLLYQVLISHPMVSKLRKPIVLLDDFADHGLRFKLNFWTEEPWEMDNLRSDLRYSIEQALRERGIKIPHQQLEIRMIENN